jgi:hypothetical protein
MLHVSATVRSNLPDVAHLTQLDLTVLASEKAHLIHERSFQRDVGPQARPSSAINNTPGSSLRLTVYTCS